MICNLHLPPNYCNESKIFWIERNIERNIYKRELLIEKMSTIVDDKKNEK